MTVTLHILNLKPPSLPIGSHGFGELFVGNNLAHKQTRCPWSGNKSCCLFDVFCQFKTENKNIRQSNVM